MIGFHGLPKIGFVDVCLSPGPLSASAALVRGMPRYAARLQSL